MILLVPQTSPNGAVMNTTTIILLCVIAYLLYRLARNRPAGKSLVQTVLPESVVRKDNEFVVNDDHDSKYRSFTSIELDVDMRHQPLLNHFLLDGYFDTNDSTSLYEYRFDGTDVQYRIIEYEHESAGFPRRNDVRDGVVQETAIREFYKDKQYSWLDVDEEIIGLKRQTEWQSLVPWGFNGFKYFLITKKLPRPEARRYLRQELERLRLALAAFNKEAGRYGVELDDTSSSGFRVLDGRTPPTNDQYKQLNASAVNFGTSDLELSYAKSMIDQLERLLGGSD